MTPVGDSDGLIDQNFTKTSIHPLNLHLPQDTISSLPICLNIHQHIKYHGFASPLTLSEVFKKVEKEQYW